MENYYDILEVSKKASEEVIEKAYKVLAKKYHPDLQKPENKKQAEEKMKKINEAYSILSNNQKRAEYDKRLIENEEEYTKMYRQQNQSQERYNQSEQIYRQQVERKIRQETYYNQDENQIRQEAYKNQKQRQTKEQINKQQSENQKYEKEYRENIQRKIQEEYNNAYNNYLRSLGYKIKEKWTFKKFLNFIKAIAIMAVIFIILWFFPPTNKLIVAFYESNPILQAICNIIGKIIEAIWTTICNLFTHPPKI